MLERLQIKMNRVVTVFAIIGFFVLWLLQHDLAHVYYVLCAWAFCDIWNSVALYNERKANLRSEIIRVLRERSLNTRQLREAADPDGKMSYGTFYVLLEEMEDEGVIFTYRAQWHDKFRLVELAVNECNPTTPLKI